MSGGEYGAHREAMWDQENPFNTDGDLYKNIAKVNEVRKAHKTQASPQEEAYVNNELYAFYRGDVLYAFTNNPDETVSATIKVKWNSGTVICNIFNPTIDCPMVNSDQTLYIMMQNGQAKIFVKGDDPLCKCLDTTD